MPRSETYGCCWRTYRIPFFPGPRISSQRSVTFPTSKSASCLTWSNSVYGREDPLEALDRAFPRLGLVHLSDTPLDVWRHDAVGYGVVPFEDFGKALRKRRYSGDVVLEIISPDPDRQIRESVDALGRLGW